MLIVGVDLSGPANSADTSAVALRLHGDRLIVVEALAGADDYVLLARIGTWASEEEVVVGLDAPLSYNVGGGDRPGDTRLRSAITAVGLRSGTVMTPTFNRMVYLTVRGIAVSRMLLTIKPRAPRVVEVHPSATMSLRGGPVPHILNLKREEDSRWELLSWLESQGLEGVATVEAPIDHYVAACASALAAWKWSSGHPVWVERAASPIHPFDFAC